MRILIVGSGAREHVLAWAVGRGGSHDVLVAPGNGGTADYGSVHVEGLDEPNALVRAVEASGVDLTVIGPEVPLVNGVVDALRGRGHAVVGPTAAAARLEGSKAFAKAFMARHAIPTANFAVFERAAYDDAAAFVAALGGRCVVKASGLAAGKGVLVCTTPEASREALDHVMRDAAFGTAGDEVVIEELMEGEEASVFVLTDGETFRILAPAQDHKRIGEGDTGLNTGGMGAYAPAPVVTDALMETVRRTIIEPTLEGMRAERHPYTGVLFVGLMLTQDGPKVVEYNCRFGDPEAQVVLPLIDGDVADLLHKTATGRLAGADVQTTGSAAACVVMASRGYPGAYEKGHAITGIEAAEAVPGVRVFQAGTRVADGVLVTNGGRVLSVQASGADLAEALERAYIAADLIQFEGAYLRRDIGQKGLARLATS